MSTPPASTGKAWHDRYWGDTETKHLNEGRKVGEWLLDHGYNGPRRQQEGVLVVQRRVAGAVPAAHLQVRATPPSLPLGDDEFIKQMVLFNKPTATWYTFAALPGVLGTCFRSG